MIAFISPFFGEKILVNRKGKFLVKERENTHHFWLQKMLIDFLNFLLFLIFNFFKKNEGKIFWKLDKAKKDERIKVNWKWYKWRNFEINWKIFYFFSKNYFDWKDTEARAVILIYTIFCYHCDYGASLFRLLFSS